MKLLACHLTRLAGLAILLGPTAQAQSPDSPARRDTTSRATLPTVEVIGSPRALRRIPGSGMVLQPEVLTPARLLSTGEALRKVPGLHVREEEGLGLRPNIGVRGLNPNRSSTVLLLEDGVPMTIAPYGDNAAYYHPPVNRFSRIEVLKGSGQILFGPRTIGGVINYITPDAPAVPAGTTHLAAGGREYLLAEATYGGTWSGNQLLLRAMRKQGAGSRDNTGSELTDLNLKAGLSLGEGHMLTLKANHYVERTNATYAGLTEAEYAADPRWNPFRHDSLFLRRTGVSGTLRSLIGPVLLTATAYAHGVSRAWWRQSNSSTERPLDRGDPACGGMDNLSVSCGIQGAPRDYFVWGVEPRLMMERRTGSAGHTVEFGFRAHFERQERRTIGGALPNSRTPGPAGNPGSGLTEDNLRANQAYAAWLQDRITMGGWTMTPGLRVEGIRYQRTNRLPVADHPEGVSGRSSLVQVIPGLGVTRQVGATTIYAGLHRGFAPPRTEDLISNSTGGVVELDAELSWNAEVGARTDLGTGVQAEVTAFRMDFENQIIPANLAGGAGATLTSAGRTLHAGAEVMLALEGAVVRRALSPLSATLAYTWLPVARFEGARFAWIGTGGNDVEGKVYGAQNAAATRARVSVSGNRLPYAPRHLVTASVTARAGARARFGLEAVHVGRQETDAANSTVRVPDGQQGPIPAATWWNATASLLVPALRSTLYLSGRNLADRVHIVDRSRGLLPGMGRIIQAGITTGF